MASWDVCLHNFFHTKMQTNSKWLYHLSKYTMIEHLICLTTTRRSHSLWKEVGFFSQSLSQLRSVANDAQSITALSTKSAEAVRKSVKNESEVQALISLGTKKRRSRCTRMNSSSSRSHAILTICLGIEHQDNTKRESVINLVDLAGTESQRQTGDIPPETQAEAKSINEGLLNIKLVIDAMVKGTHIPYRTSLITTVLQSLLQTKISFFLHRSFNFQMYFVSLQVHWKKNHIWHCWVVLVRMKTLTVEHWTRWDLWRKQSHSKRLQLWIESYKILRYYSNH